jgi:nicotinamidase-related amidase
MPLWIDACPYPWPHDRSLRPATTALLIIDMQRDFCLAGGYIASMGYDIAPAQALLEPLARTAALARGWGAKIIYTREGHRPDLSDLPAQKSWRSRQSGPGIGAAGPMGRFLVRGESGHGIVPELAPEAGDIVIDKPGYSAFYATDLHQILTVAGIRHLILSGLTTDVCVHSTLRDAVDRGYECLVLSDLCATTEPANHHAALNTITTEGGIFGAVTTAEKLGRSLIKALGQNVARHHPI